ncbi:hypothetical protein CE255_18490 [Salmonella enterica]|nr:hypothetical protein [Salmonella enterica]EBA9709742.1 hypothetical protein [Salmonella enterica]
MSKKGDDHPVLTILTGILVVGIWWFGHDSDTTDKSDEAAQTKLAAKVVKQDVCKKDDYKCLGRENTLDAAYQCRPLIRAAAGHHDYEFTGYFGELFNNFSWQKGKPEINYIGDMVKFTNDFGAHIKMKYECTYNIKTKKITNFNIYVPN